MATAPKSVLIVGGDSNIGRSLKKKFSGLGHLVTHTTRRVEALDKTCLPLDLSEPEKFKPIDQYDVAFICAGITNISQCEQHPEATSQINIHNTIEIIRKLNEQGTFIVFFSSNVVFSGEKPRVLNTDKTQPTCNYGKQKSRVEDHLIGSSSPYAIVRLTKVIGEQFALLEKWAECLVSQQSITAFSDLKMAPISMAALTEVCTALLTEQTPGVFQLSGPEDTTYAEIGSYIAQQLGVTTSLVEAMTIDEVGANILSRPKHTTLDTVCSQTQLEFLPEHWTTVIDMFLESKGYKLNARAAKQMQAF